MATLALGRKNAAGDWIITERVEAACLSTDCPQIVITGAIEGSGLNLTHFQSGFRLLGPFASRREAQAAARRLASLFPIEDWNLLGELARSWNRNRIKRMFSRLRPEDQEWMRQHGAKL